MQHLTKHACKACWQNETAIVKEKTDNGISFPEARRLVEARSASTPSVTYPAMVKSTKSISTQTDIVNCTCHCTIDVIQAQPGTSSTSFQTYAIAPCVIADFANITGNGTFRRLVQHQGQHQIQPVVKLPTNIKQ